MQDIRCGGGFGFVFLLPYRIMTAMNTRNEDIVQVGVPSPDGRGRQATSGTRLLWALCSAVVLCSAGCSTEHYKADADKEVYKIIDDK